MLLVRIAKPRPICVLLQPTNLIPVENEVHLPQTSFWGPPDGMTLSPKLDDVGVLDERLPPDLDEYFLK